ncbi:MAG: hypothetical protein R3C61_15790 [Bacteroidia bacterium]
MYKSIFTLGMILSGFSLQAQMTSYHFQRPLPPLKAKGWYEIIVPETVLSRLNDDLSDIRIFKISAEDTVETPYILQQNGDRYEVEAVPFQMVNTSKTGDNESFVTLRPEEELTINHIELDIRPSNYDLLATLEGSNNRLKWFIIQEDIRLVGISNDQVNYHFSTLTFSDADYKFYRIKLNDANAEIIRATVGKLVQSEGKYRPFTVIDQSEKNDLDKKITEITIELKDRYPVNRLEFDVDKSTDFYRPVTVSWLSESVETAEGVKEVWKDFGGFTLSSLENNVLDGEVRFTNRLKIAVYNYDDIPLSFGKTEVLGPVYVIQTQLEAGAQYLLAYGNPDALKPRYDMVYFQNKIPEHLTPLSPGEEIVITPSDSPEDGLAQKQEAVKENLLWVVMGLVIVVLGFFTVKMMRNQSGKDQSQL